MILVAFLLGLIEGLTEFLPVSSTGHLIVAGHALGFTGPEATVFSIVIQLGAILAIVWEYRVPMGRVAAGLATPRAAREPLGLVANLALAFLPSGLAGLLLHRVIEERLFGPITVAWALIGGGVAMLLIERIHPAPGTSSILKVRWPAALGIGLAQVASLFPGVSRAAATIMGGMLCGLDRRAATEFSFYLAVPTMAAATGYDLLKSWSLLSAESLTWLAVGFVTAFVSALAAVRVFLRFISRHDFRPFAWYRIAFGALVLIYFR